MYNVGKKVRIVSTKYHTFEIGEIVEIVRGSIVDGEIKYLVKNDEGILNVIYPFNIEVVSDKTEEFSYDYVISQLIQNPDRVYENVDTGHQIRVVDGKITGAATITPVTIDSSWVEVDPREVPFNEAFVAFFDHGRDIKCELDGACEIFRGEWVDTEYIFSETQIGEGKWFILGGEED